MKREKSPARLAVAGVGLVGQRHAALVAARAELVGLADPASAVGSIADALGAPLFANIHELLEAVQPDGVIIATPNQSHVADGLACIKAGAAVLVEKPIADNAAAAERLIKAAAEARVPVLVGHHRRYNPIIQAARDAIDEGRIGRIVAAHATCWLAKPEDYFDVEWRRKPGAGPVLINLIHDVELLIHLCGPIVGVQAAEANAARGFEVEDTAAIILHFANGALGTISISDSIAAPWSWELTAGENPAYAQTGAFTYMIGGTEGSLSVPDLRIWRHEDTPHWWNPMTAELVATAHIDPLEAQIDHFAEVALARAVPRVSGEDGLAALRVIEAVKEAATNGRLVRL